MQEKVCWFQLLLLILYCFECGVKSTNKCTAVHICVHITGSVEAEMSYSNGTVGPQHLYGQHVWMTYYIGNYRHHPENGIAFKIVRTDF